MFCISSFQDKSSELGVMLRAHLLCDRNVFRTNDGILISHLVPPMFPLALKDSKSTFEMGSDDKHTHHLV